MDRIEIADALSQGFEDRKHDPVELGSWLFDSKYWTKQEEIMRSVWKHKKTAVKSCNSGGKSRIAAEISLLFLLAFRPSRVITTAPTFLQVEEILWKEIHALYYKSKIPFNGKLTSTELDMGIADGYPWQMIGISTNEENRMQGFKSPHLLVVGDEALGLDPIIIRAIEGLLPFRILYIGNPLDPVGDFYNCFQSDLWNCITINGYDCVKWQEENHVIPGLITREWIEERRDEWGAGSAEFQARILGEFPQSSDSAVIQREWVEKAREKEPDNDEYDYPVEAVDIASKHGKSSTVFTERTGNTIFRCTPDKEIGILASGDKLALDYVSKKLRAIVFDSDGMGCITKDTQIWTPIGWRNVQDIAVNDLIYSKDEDNNLITSKVKSNNKRENIEIIKAGDYSFSFCHFIPCKTRKEIATKLKSWESICDKSVLLDNAFNWTGSKDDFVLKAHTVKMPNGGIYETTKQLSIKRQDFAQFLGWYLSEGCLGKNGGRLDEINIIQSQKSQHNKDIHNVLSQCGFKYSATNQKNGTIRYRLFNKTLYKWLQKHCYKNGRTAPFKIVPKWLKESASKAIRKFLDSFIQGDGYVHKGNNVYYTSSVILSDDILELIYKTGCYGVKRKRYEAGSEGYIGDRKITRQYDGYNIYEYKNTNICHDGRYKDPKFFKGDVWELKVDSYTTMFCVRFKDYRAFWVFNEGLDEYLKRKHVPYLAFHGGHGYKAMDSRKYKNLRTQFYCALAKKFEKGLISLKSLPQKEYEVLKAQLCCMNYLPHDPLGRIRIETKEDLHTRQIMSPDSADSVMMSEYAIWMGNYGDTVGYSYR